MRPEEDIDHYVAIEKLLQVDYTVGISDFFRKLALTPAGGAVVRTAETRQYVEGRTLAKVVLEEVGSATGDTALRGTVGEYLMRVVTYPVDSQPLKADSVIDPVELDAAGTKVLHPVTADDVVRGFLFSDAAMKKAAVVAPPQWVCEDDHLNDDPDDGYCSHCPRRIKGLKS